MPNLTIQDHNQADWCSTVCNKEALKEEEAHAVNCMEVFFRTRQGGDHDKAPMLQCGSLAHGMYCLYYNQNTYFTIIVLNTYF